MSNRAKFDRCLAHVLPFFGDGCEASEGQPYWKDPELWECSVKSPVSAGPVAEQVLGCLLAARRIALGWLTFGTLTAESAEGFMGVFAAGSSGATTWVPGLAWASFQMVAVGPQSSLEPRDDEG
ncbi:MAG TPA: hypothetical protein VFS43_35780 [Polyangiaceae bacterium]|nr:hypothetical protein [Polyangiaceae bacterium]